MKSFFDEVSLKASKMVTWQYSTSFSLGIKFLNHNLRNSIYSIYGFVRFADEIVDSFHDYNKAELLAQFSKETFEAIERGISLNPILNSFQWAVNKHNVDKALIEKFLISMEMDLHKTSYTEETYKDYIVGSAEVVGLMCLKVFVDGNENEYKKLTPYAMSLGSAFQKINFLRDLNADYKILGRVYFPNIDFEAFNAEAKLNLEKDIAMDFEKGLQGIRLLPKNARLGVYIAYIYYNTLFNKIKNIPAEKVMEERIRIPNGHKMALFATSYIKNSLNRI
jgi:phytoene synthase